MPYSCDLMYQIQSLLYKIVAIFAIWFLMRHKREYQSFRYAVLILLLSSLIAYYTIGAVVCRYLKLDLNEVFWFSRLYNVVLSTFFITIVVKFSPISIDTNRLILFPAIAKKTSLYIAIQLFFFILCTIIYINISMHSHHICTNSILSYQISEKHYMAICVYILIDVYAVIGEEMVFRYLAINTLRPVLRSARSLIIVSSGLWMIMHTSLNVDLFIVGMFLAYCYIRTGYLSLCIFFHFVFNISVASQWVYILLSSNKIIDFSPFQYAATIFIILISSYHLCEYLLMCEKSGHTT